MRNGLTCDYAPMAMSKVCPMWASKSPSGHQMRALACETAVASAIGDVPLRG